MSDETTTASPAPSQEAPTPTPESAPAPDGTAPGTDTPAAPDAGAPAGSEEAPASEGQSTNEEQSALATAEESEPPSDEAFARALEAAFEKRRERRRREANGTLVARCYLAMLCNPEVVRGAKMHEPEFAQMLAANAKIHGAAIIAAIEDGEEKAA